MSRFGGTIKSYIFWTHERGSVQYDVMVTLILAFIFLSPHFMNFHDKPAYVPRASGMVSIQSIGSNAFLCELDAARLPAGDSIESRMIAVVEPILGKVSLQRYQAEPDARGRPVAYKLWVSRN